MSTRCWRRRLADAALARLPWQLIEEQAQPAAESAKAAADSGSQRQRQQPAKRRLALCLATLGHLALLLIAAFGSADRRSVEQFWLRRHLTQAFAPPSNGSHPANQSTVAGFWRWTKNRLLPELYSSPAAGGVLRTVSQPTLRLSLSPASGSACPAGLPTQLLSRATGGAGVCLAPDTGDTWTSFETASQTLDAANLSVAMATIDSLESSGWAKTLRTRRLTVEFVLFQPGCGLLAACQIQLRLPVAGAGGQYHLGLWTHPVRNYPVEASASTALAFELASVLFGCALIGVVMATRHRLGFARQISSYWLCHRALCLCAGVASGVALALRCSGELDARRRLSAGRSAAEAFAAVKSTAEFGEAFASLMAIQIFLCTLQLLEAMPLHPATAKYYAVIGKVIPQLLSLSAALCLLCLATCLHLLAALCSESGSETFHSFSALMQSLLATELRAARFSNWRELYRWPMSALLVSAFALAASLVCARCISVLVIQGCAKESAKRRHELVDNGQDAPPGVLASIALSPIVRLLRCLAAVLAGSEPRLKSRLDYRHSKIESQVSVDLRNIRLGLHLIHLRLIRLSRSLDAQQNQPSQQQRAAEEVALAKRQFCRAIRRTVYQSDNPLEWPFIDEQTTAG